MVGQRKSMRMRSQILELQAQGKGPRAISRILKISRNTVRGILRHEQAPSPSLIERSKTWKDELPWPEIQLELAKRYVTFKQLHLEYAKDRTTYDSFIRELKRRIPKDLEEAARVRLAHPPGERAFIDYCDGLEILDQKTGEIRNTHLFVGVLPCSSYTYGEFVFSQRKMSFLSSQERMFAYFGGVPKYIGPDNLKSAVHKADLYDPEVNATYVDFANHCGFAVVPARPHTPRDKASVETQIGVIQRQFFSEFRNHTFTSLTEINACFKIYLARLNSSVMKDYGVSRLARFEAEKPCLQPLPEARFEIATYKTSSVHPDCHIQVMGNFYSVPYLLIGQLVRVKITEHLIEVFHPFTHESVAIHGRVLGEKRKFVTIDTHYPPYKLATARFDLEIAKRDATRIGPETLELVSNFFKGNFPLQYLRRVQGLLQLRKKFSNESIEYAVKQAKMFNNLRLKYITNCAERYSQQGARLRIVTAPLRDPSHVHLHDPRPGEKLL